jgi:hypothetical protein
VLVERDGRFEPVGDVVRFDYQATPEDIQPPDPGELRGLGDRIGTITGRLEPGDIARWFGLPPHVLDDVAPRLVCALQVDFSGFYSAMARATRSFQDFARAAGAVDYSLRSFENLWWSMLTPAQRRRHGKRLVREEIARRRMEKLIVRENPCTDADGEPCGATGCIHCDPAMQETYVG